MVNSSAIKSKFFLGLRVQIKTRLLTQLLHPTSQTRVIAYPTLKMKKKSLTVLNLEGCILFI